MNHQEKMYLIKQDLKDNFGVAEVEDLTDLEILETLVDLRKNANLPYNFVVRGDKLEWIGELKL